MCLEEDLMSGGRLRNKAPVHSVHSQNLSIVVKLAWIRMECKLILQTSEHMFFS